MGTEYKHGCKPVCCCKKECCCKIVIDNILICGDKHKKCTSEYEVEDDCLKDKKKGKKYEIDKKGVTIINKLKCKCCDDDDDCKDDDDDD